MGVTEVAMDRHGLILWENEAAGSRKVSKYLPGLRDAIFGPTIGKTIPNPTIPIYYVFLYGVGGMGEAIK